MRAELDSSLAGCRGPKDHDQGMVGGGLGGALVGALLGLAVGLIAFGGANPAMLISVVSLAAAGGPPEWLPGLS